MYNSTVKKFGFESSKVMFTNTCNNCKSVYETSGYRVANILGVNSKDEVVVRNYDTCPVCHVQNIQNFKIFRIAESKNIFNLVKEKWKIIKNNFLDNIKVES